MSQSTPEPEETGDPLDVEVTFEQQGHKQTIASALGGATLTAELDWEVDETANESLGLLYQVFPGALLAAMEKISGAAPSE